MRRSHAIHTAGIFRPLPGSRHATHGSACKLILSVVRRRLSIGGSFPPDPAGLLSEGGDVIKLHIIEGSLTIPIPGIKRV